MLVTQLTFLLYKVQEDTTLRTHALTASQNWGNPLTMATLNLTLNSVSFPARLCVRKNTGFVGQSFLGFSSRIGRGASQITIRLSNKYYIGELLFGVGSQEIYCFWFFVPCPTSRSFGMRRKRS